MGRSPKDGPLYIPQGVLVLPGQRDRLLSSARTARLRRQAKPKPKPFAPVENERWYASSTRVKWPRAWSADRRDLTLSGRNGLKMLLRAKSQQTLRDAKALQENDGDMDAIVTTSAISRCMTAAWDERKDGDIGAQMSVWSANDGRGANGVFSMPDLGIDPFGIEEGAASVHARRHEGRTWTGGRLHGDMRGAAAFDAARHPDERRDSASVLASSLSDEASFLEEEPATPEPPPPPPTPAEPEVARRPRMRLVSSNKTGAYAGPASHVFHEREHDARNLNLRASMGIRIAKAPPPKKVPRRVSVRAGTPKGYQKTGFAAALADQVDLARTSILGKKVV